jgi:hypothetical protein
VLKVLLTILKRNSKSALKDITAHETIGKQEINTPPGETVAISPVHLNGEIF